MLKKRDLLAAAYEYTQAASVLMTVAARLVWEGHRRARTNVQNPMNSYGDLPMVFAITIIASGICTMLRIAPLRFRRRPWQNCPIQAATVPTWSNGLIPQT